MKLGRNPNDQRRESRRWLENMQPRSQISRCRTLPSVLARGCQASGRWGEESIRGKTMTDQAVRHGGCLCGAVRYEVTGEPYKSGLCHCGDCRKITGTAFLAYADWRRSQFRSTGLVQEYAGRSFCPTCGSRLFSLSDEAVEIFLGSLDDAPNGVAPEAEIWVRRREPWLRDLDVPQFSQDKP